MRILVTGAGGFVGGRVAKVLQDAGYDVRLLLRKPKDIPELAGAEVALGHLGDHWSLRQALKGTQGVVHCAAKSGVWGPLSTYIENNAMGTSGILAAARLEGLSFFVHTSSYSVVHSCNSLEGVTEARPYTLDPRAPYAYSKMLAEREVLMANCPGFKTLALRPHLIWGPGDPHLLPRLADRARRKKLFVFSGGPHMVDATYIDNVARAHLLALSKLIEGAPVDGEAFFVGQGQPEDLNQLIGRLLMAVNAPPPRARIPINVGKGVARIAEWFWQALDLSGEPPLTSFVVTQMSTSHWSDLGKAKRLLGYEPKISVAEGLERLAEAAKEGYLQPGL
ncbi:MAG: NAD-dependent epimerase/dehydratase family protein [Deltaproteobacteria bacterium]|jgi:nucleoside-diphosphate-sugar epimerase|nr:NAD-dependent epimerase/dehydratase family protein [Deltaproteobacteria bacterium]